MQLNLKVIEKELISLITDYLFPNPKGFKDKIRRFTSYRILLKNKDEPLCEIMWLDDIDIVALIMEIEKKYNIKIEDDYFLRNIKGKSLCSTTLQNLVEIVYSSLRIKKGNKNESKKRVRKQ